MSESNSNPKNKKADELPDILIQDLDDIEEEVPPVPEAEPVNYCVRCDAVIPDGELYCVECSDLMSSYPILKRTVVYSLLTFIVCLFSVLLLGVNLLIAEPVNKGDVCLAKGDIEGCYTEYLNAYNLSSSLQKNIFPGSPYTFFSVGSNTLAKQIIAVDKLNGTVAAGGMIDSFFPVAVPKNLQGIKTEYNLIKKFVDAVSSAFTSYTNNLKETDVPSFESMSEILEDVISKHPDTPDYMKEYYRFSLSYSMANDPKSTAKLLDKVIALAPDELWLYAGEGINAYKLSGEYTKALSICNNLLKVDPSEPSAVAYTVSVLRLLGKFDEALTVYDKFVSVYQTTPELERQRAVVLMLQGNTKDAESILTDSFSTEKSTLEHLATIVVCAFKNNSTEAFEMYKKMLDGYVTFSQVEAFIGGEITLGDIFLSDGGEIH